MFGYLYSDELDGFQLIRYPYSVPQTEDDQVDRSPIPIPVWAWDENVEWQNSRDWKISELTPENEYPTELPPVNPPPPVLEDFGEDLGLYNQIRYLVTTYDYEDFWNPLNLKQINFFDDFEPDYSNIVENITRLYIIPSTEEQDERVNIFPVPTALGFLNAQFDDWDWSYRRDFWLSQATTEEDTGEPPLFIFPIFHWEDDDYSKNFDQLFALPIEGYEDFSLIQNFPPPPVPITDFTDEVVWQHFLDARFGLLNLEEEFGIQVDVPFIPIFGWDEVDWQQFVNLGYGLPVAQMPEDDDSGYGWFLNPFIPPPAVCAGPPLGPDGDTIMNYFGGNAQPLQVLFCRVCKSGKPLLVRGDYAIWCQDCCAFVSKQDTFMMTVRAPGQFKAVF